MAFLQAGIVNFPTIPLLEILDLWIGVGPDDYKLLYRITQGIWSKRFVIVQKNHFAFSLVPEDGGFATLTPKMDVRSNCLSWEGVDGSLLRCDRNGNWTITKPGWDDKYYSVSWNSDSMTATPHGWPEEDEREPVDYQLDWPRWQSTKSGWGTPTAFDTYTPASTYVNTPTVGNIKVGQPCWNNGTVGRITRGLKKPFQYLFEDGTVAFYTDPDSSNLVKGDINGYHYEGTPPEKETSWTITGENEQGATSTLSFSWYNYVAGPGERHSLICEMGRLL